MTESFRPTIFRQQAREALRGKWGISAVAALICVALVSGTGYLADLLILYVGNVVLQIVFGGIISMGVSWLFLDVSNGQQVKIETIFEAFKGYLRYLTGNLLVFIYTILWMLLLIVPGLIKSISYSMTFYIMRENPGIGAEDAIKLSMKMMQGHKWEYFLLQLSFIGWVLLSILTLGIGFLWLTPYCFTATANFYKELKKEYEIREGLNA